MTVEVASGGSKATRCSWGVGWAGPRCEALYVQRLSVEDEVVKAVVQWLSGWCCRVCWMMGMSRSYGGYWVGGEAECDVEMVGWKRLKRTNM